MFDSCLPLAHAFALEIQEFSVIFPVVQVWPQVTIFGATPFNLNPDLVAASQVLAGGLLWNNSSSVSME